MTIAPPEVGKKNSRRMEVATVGLKEHVGIPAFGQRSNGFCFKQLEEEVVVDNSSESSSIGVQSSSSEDDDRGGDDDEVQSKPKDGAFGSFVSLEDSLPIKRGLSSFFTGKSKSFATLSDVAGEMAAAELAKPEHSFNKRRRILMACKNSWSRRASYSSLLPPLPPLTTVEREDDDDDDDDETTPAKASKNGGGDGLLSLPPLPRHPNGKDKDERKAKVAFRSPRSFSLSDLQHV